MTVLTGGEREQSMWVKKCWGGVVCVWGGRLGDVMNGE